MTLSEIIDCLRQEPGLLLELPAFSEAELNREFRHFTSDSREVKAGSCYIAIRGGSVDGHQFIESSLEKGAALVLAEDRSSKNILKVKNTRLASALLASRFYQEPSKDLLILGVTGTSGKTTTTYLLESILKAAGKKIGLIGTVEVRYGGKRIEATHTTPDPWSIQKVLAEMSDVDCEAVVMEVSSHALKQNRVSGIAFDGALFTNLTPEHLDYHPDLEDYYASKKLLFTEEFARSRRAGKEPKAVLHVGDKAGKRLAKEIPGSLAFDVPSDVKLDAQGIRGTFSGVPIESKLIARFNAENIAGAVALARAIGIPANAVKKGIESLPGVPGRLERVEDPQGRVILVDYAHKPDALEKVLKTLQPMRAPGAKLICVFGCGGDRDATKRPVMGKIACELADQVILTSDNPRTEDPEKILDAIEKGCAGFKNFTRVVDRETAIQQAVRTAKPGDIVLIAGKGHEDYQIIGKEKRPFDDRVVARRALGR